uniref:Cilia- and flagella-associated protein 263 n=1 Tax=Sphaeramia orbicularis TaxID=375764 RepID=A0A673A6F6_9TELE
ENDMFERFISRLDPQDLVSQAVAEDPGSRASIVDRIQQLTLEQKLYLAQNEVTETQQDQEKLRRKYEKIQDNYMTSLEEAELRLGEIKKAMNELERRLLKPLKDNRLEINDPEKMLQFIKDKSKVKINQLEKYSLKNQALKAHEKKLQQQLQKRREMGKAEYEVEKINLTAERAIDSEMLQKVTCESSELSSDIIKKKQILAKTEEAIQRAEEERLKAQLFNQHLHRQMTDYQAPSVTEYMYVKDKHKKLKHSVHTWERKVGIAEMALKTHSKAWNNQRSTLTPMNSAEAGTRFRGHQISVKLPYIAEDCM